jgi:hypothetical protein
MKKGSKVALKHAANAIDGTRPIGGVELGARAKDLGISTFASQDVKGRPFPSVYLAKRAGFAPNSQASAQRFVADTFGLSAAQVEKLDDVAASTHNIVQRAGRVARFIRRVVEQPGYVGFPSRQTNGAVGASL